MAKGASTLANGTIKNASTGLVSLQGVQLSVGEDINFIVSPKGSAVYDSTGLQATATPSVEANVPSLSWWTLIGLALVLAGLGYLGLRRRTASSPAS